MDWTPVLGLAGVAVGAVLAYVFQRRNAVASQLLVSRIEAYSDAATSLHQYRKVNMDRHTDRLDIEAANAKALDQAAYDQRSETHAVLNRVQLVASKSAIRDTATQAKATIDEMTESPDSSDLAERNQLAIEQIGHFVTEAGKEIRAR